MPKKSQDLSGKTFGSWEAVKRNGNSKSGHAIWLCQCECGKVSNVTSRDLLSGHSKSCGCKRGTIGDHVRTHGKSQTRIYRIWRGMLNRCYLPSTNGYANYGGRGISEWKNDFSKFEEWALNHGYGENLTIDRIDSDGDYVPGNCRWATRSEQNKNRKPQSEWKNHLTK